MSPTTPSSPVGRAPRRSVIAAALVCAASALLPALADAAIARVRWLPRDGASATHYAVYVREAGDTYAGTPQWTGNPVPAADGTLSAHVSFAPSAAGAQLLRGRRRRQRRGKRAVGRAPDGRARSLSQRPVLGEDGVRLQCETRRHVVRRRVVLQRNGNLPERRLRRPHGSAIAPMNRPAPPMRATTPRTRARTCRRPGAARRATPAIRVSPTPARRAMPDERRHRARARTDAVHEPAVGRQAAPSRGRFPADAPIDPSSTGATDELRSPDGARPPLVDGRRRYCSGRAADGNLHRFKVSRGAADDLEMSLRRLDFRRVDATWVVHAQMQAPDLMDAFLERSLSVMVRVGEACVRRMNASCDQRSARSTCG